jgi:hypothetical protein
VRLCLTTTAATATTSHTAEALQAFNYGCKPHFHFVVACNDYGKYINFEKTKPVN